MTQIISYNRELKREWDDFVSEAKNSTFLFLRDYMDYHESRFVDCSLMFYRKGVLRAVWPLNRLAVERRIVSHGGLTYGGLLLAKEATLTEVSDYFYLGAQWMRERLDALTLTYKSIPYIYASLPSEEDLYLLFRAGARLSARCVSSALSGENRLSFSLLRRRGVAKAQKRALCFRETEDYEEFWKILSAVLNERHHCSPVHSLSEICLLHKRFPRQIRLFAVYDSEKMCAGVVVYETKQVAHFQYIAANSVGREWGALDGLFEELIHRIFVGKRYIDFGISTEQLGRWLNRGLLQQKEGFGARSVVYDTYEVNLSQVIRVCE